MSGPYFLRHCGNTEPHEKHDYIKEFGEFAVPPSEPFTCLGTEYRSELPAELVEPVTAERYRVEQKDWEKWNGANTPVVVLARLEYIADAVAVRDLHANVGAYIVDALTGYTLS